MNKQTKGYKVTDENMQCRGFQFALNIRFKQEGELSICNNGFHFCELPQHCFNYYEFNPRNRVFEVLAIGDVETEGDKSCCLELELVREIPWDEVLRIVNTGSGNSGHSNSGNSNSGNCNSGDSNSGYRNSGYRNSGNSNSGYRNSGHSNSGDRNSGDRNSGYWNSGDRNSGDSNSGYRNSGAFCTDKDPKLTLFNKTASITVKQWEEHPACQLMYNIDPTLWVPSSIMSEEEKSNNPGWENAEGYLKTIPIKEAWANFWHNLNEDKRSLFTSLENFDADIFYEITGVRV